MMDFDTACYGFPLYVVMMICNATGYFDLKDEDFVKTVSRYGDFLVGYQEYHKLTQAEIDVFYDFVGIYHFQLQATIIEIQGLDCVDHNFLDAQLKWLEKWKTLCGLHYEKTGP